MNGNAKIALLQFLQQMIWQQWKTHKWYKPLRDWWGEMVPNLWSNNRSWNNNFPSWSQKFPKSLVSSNLIFRLHMKPSTMLNSSSETTLKKTFGYFFHLWISPTLFFNSKTTLTTMLTPAKKFISGMPVARKLQADLCKQIWKIEFSLLSPISNLFSSSIRWRQLSVN